MKALMTPRFMLMIWGGIGAVFLAGILIAASQTPGGAGDGDVCKISAANRSPSLLAGEMIDFTYAFTKRQAPATSFRDENGAEVQLSDFRGQTVLVNFWATWCAPCLKELPSLDALEGMLGGDEFVVAAIAADAAGADAARAYFDRLGVKNLKLYTDERLQFASAVGGVSALPVSVLYDKNGTELGRLSGEADWSGEDARRLIRTAITCS